MHVIKNKKQKTHRFILKKNMFQNNFAAVTELSTIGVSGLVVRHLWQWGEVLHFMLPLTGVPSAAINY